MRSLWLIILLPLSCSPESDRRSPSPQPVTSETGTTSPKSDSQEAHSEGLPLEVPFKSLGWDGSRYTYKPRGSLQASPFTGVTTDHFKSGGLKARYGLRQGLYHGLVEEWYENGQQKTKTSYQNGRHEGDNFYWNEDGTLQSHKVWKDDVLVKETPPPPH